MKTHYISIFTLLFSSLFFGQVGIQTDNPQGIFHVDAMKNNSPVIQENDDFVVKNSTGNVGIGILNPDNKLHVNGKIKITDGTEGNSKILVSRSDGQARWVLPAILRPNVRGTLPTSVVTFDSGQAGQTSRLYNYSGFSITLPEGKWIVNNCFTFTNIGGTSAGSGPRVSYWLRTYLSTNPSNFMALEQNNFTHLGPAGSNTAYGGMLNSNTPNPTRIGSIAGSSIIEVTAASQTLYVMIEQKPSGYYTFSSSYLENYLYAIPID